MQNKPEIHEKVWGREIWIANNNLYCGKILELNEGFRCSIHHHKIKDETFYVLTGMVLMKIDKEEFLMKPGDTIQITPNTNHRFSGLEQSKIIEISTHHLEEDSYRLENSGKIPVNEFEMLKRKYL